MSDRGSASRSTDRSSTETVREGTFREPTRSARASRTVRGTVRRSAIEDQLPAAEARGTITPCCV
ncbi:MAG TPA: hypothetical protein DCQ98_22080 [Planctomycetaceae bacterium]|nr:hypothetical protein [Planctomycetaceae bacterium]